MQLRGLGLGLRSSGIALFVSTLTLLAACGGSGTGGDDAGMADAFSLTPSTLFGPCVDDAQCPGEGAICRRATAGYPGGYCTIPCDDRTLCDTGSVYHHCIQLEGETRTYCERRCLNGLDCGREGYSCAGDGTIPPSGGVCIPVCTSDEQCGEGTVCDLYSGECVPPPAPTTGALTGEPCSSDAGCRSGVCVTEVSGGAPTGWIMGYCAGNCVLPRGWNSTSLYMGDTLPAGSCQGDAICFPGGQLAIGDLGTCYRACTTDGDCREGYGCLSRFMLSSGAASFSNGICVPSDCGTSGCPSGYTCVAVPASGGGTRNVCAPS